MSLAQGARPQTNGSRSRLSRYAARLEAAADGQPDGESGPFANLGFEGQGAVVLGHDNVARDGQTLTRALAHPFCSEEGIEDAMANCLWNP